MEGREKKEGMFVCFFNMEESKGKQRKGKEKSFIFWILVCIF
jgi:hypothetical protein